MPIVRWGRRFPTSFFDDENWLEPFWQDTAAGTGLDVYDTGEEVVVEAAVPGIPLENIDLSVEGNVLAISASKEETEEEKEDKKTIYRETRQRSFHYTTNLPRGVNAEKAEATMEDGVLRVEIPVAEEEKRKKIEIKAG